MYWIVAVLWTILVVVWAKRGNAFGPIELGVIAALCLWLMPLTLVFAIGAMSKRPQL